jgi:hypothetical protein
MNAIVRSARTTMLWFVSEFLPLTESSNFPTLAAGSRFLGSATIIGAMSASLRGRTPPSFAWSVLLAILVVALAVTLGNIVKEICFAFCAHLVNWLGHDFRRAGITPRGIPFRELRRSNGTWRRLERRGRETVCEWTDSEGKCHVRRRGRS